MEKTMGNLRIGEILLEDGIITEEHLDNALEFQKLSGHPVGIILINQNIISDETLVKYLSMQAEKLTQL
jgi:hypothetical protein